MTTFFPPSTLPAPYDIVWCRFPHAPVLGEPGPYPRPGIVINVGYDEESGEGEVQVIYGTTKLKMASRHRDFFVTNMSEMDSCGLHKATRFDLDNIVWLPWAIEWFDTLPDYSSPIIGHLSAHAVKLLQIDLAHRRAQHIAKIQPDESED